MKKYTTVLLLLLCTIPVLSQDFDRVPKQYSFEAGYRYLLSSEFDSNPAHGYTVIFDYAWQLSGFKKKKASYITVPIGYTRMPASEEGGATVSVVSYGWTVRHELAKDKNVVPWLGYGLLLNQYKNDQIDGRVFGHQTRFTLGANFMNFGRIIPFVKVEYSLTNYPIWGDPESKQYNHIEGKIGFRF